MFDFVLSNYHAVFNIVSQVSLERERQHDQTHVQSQLEKLDLLEQEYNKLTAMQALAEVSECTFHSSMCNIISFVKLIIFLKDFMYLFLEKRGREGEREGEKHQCHCLSCAPYWGPALQPRHVP